MKSAGNLIQVDSEVDHTYFKKILEETKNRIEELSFIEQRTTMVTNETSLEGISGPPLIFVLEEMTIVYNEIKKNEKELRNLLTVSEFLFDNTQEL
jgi:hypothetical protein